MNIQSIGTGLYNFGATIATGVKAGAFKVSAVALSALSSVGAFVQGYGIATGVSASLAGTGAIVLGAGILTGAGFGIAALVKHILASRQATPEASAK